MSLRLKDNLNSKYIEAANKMKSKAAKRRIVAYVESYDVLTEDPAAVLQSWTLADFSFYLEEGELVLAFPTYTFGPGAMGATVIRTGLHPRLG